MSSKTFHLNKMTVEDIFRAKKERRQRLAQLPFEQKIEIVKKLQSVVRVVKGATREVQSKQPSTKETKQS
jgi:hypothetical protein